MTPVWLNGLVTEADAARITPDDRGFLLGDGAFETLRWRDGAIRRWPRHRNRLEGALDWLQIAQPDFSAIETGAAALAERLGLSEAVLRLTVSRGAHGGGLDAPAGAPGTVLLTARALPPRPESLSLVTVPEARRAGLESERFKLTGYAEPLAARRAARAMGADMGLLVSAVDGAIVCADCANVFFVLDERLVTPPVRAGAMPGTARAALLAAAGAAGLRVAEQAVDPGDAARADGVFVTNAVIGVAPAVALDGRTLDPFHPLVLKAAALEAEAV